MEAYCPHYGRCFVYDFPHSCERLCRLSRGSGELATTLVETLQLRLLLLNFDRTLCSTKSGASPLPSGKRVKEGFAHTIDHGTLCYLVWMSVVLMWVLYRYFVC